MSDADATSAKPVEEQPQATAAPAETPAAAEAEVEETPAEEPKSEETSAEETHTEEAPAENPKDGAASSDVLKTTAKIDRKDFKNNRKFDPESREVTDDPEAIRKQVEFYFGDWNFPQDKFMWETAGGAENKPIPISKIHSFKRMRVFQPYSAVVAALRESKLLDVVDGPEGSAEGSESVKRKTAYVPQSQSRAKNEASTVYAKGFGDETPSMQFDLESFFAQYGEVKGVKLRRTNEGLFKGSVFVTFADEETAARFVGLETKPQWQSHDLKIMTKKAYCDEKSDLIRQGKLEPNTTVTKKFFEGKESSKGGSANANGQNDWKKRRDNDQKNGFRGGRGGGRGRGGRGRGGRGGGGSRGGRRDRDQRDRRNGGGEGQGNAKRAREDDGGASEAPAAKKVDAKEA
ncbi:hypothetical protein GMORB2_4111 [Geosmithia morbida]|uniref:Uncharacterized protein n=1 Tax=Geosmithia morbida TaxID=1094350 RepID=A0A9P4YY76_9HYPO|nr:uncharacterized protein GMORB2_4111 [Geosmithia morbida]KAF4125271.1 hypothetical protein GMORB2_4111 [Geosmithia morbida]